MYISKRLSQILKRLLFGVLVVVATFPSAIIFTMPSNDNISGAGTNTTDYLALERNLEGRPGLDQTAAI